MDYPNNLRKIRKARGLSQEQVADRVYMSAQNVSKLERGAIELRVEDLPKFARALGCQPHEILPGAQQLSADEAALLDIYGRLAPNDQQAVLRMIAALFDDREDQDDDKSASGSRN